MSPTPSSTHNRSGGYDERLAFLRSDISNAAGKDLPSRNRFEHRVERAQGPVEVIYYPRRDGREQCPEQLSLFILGKSIFFNIILIELENEVEEMGENQTLESRKRRRS
jgi:hypothetical protein